MHLLIKNMVSVRCKLFVKSELDNSNIHYERLALGEVDLTKKLSLKKRQTLKIALSRFGLVLMDDKKEILIEKVKNVIGEMIHINENLPQTNFSEYLSNKMHYDYTYLSNLFSKVIGTTIEHFIILNKIERVKELLLYNELSLTEIAYKLHYSSVCHLSNQFKKTTGLSPSWYKKSKIKQLINLENL